MSRVTYRNSKLAFASAMKANQLIVRSYFAKDAVGAYLGAMRGAIARLDAVACGMRHHGMSSLAGLLPHLGLISDPRSGACPAYAERPAPQRTQMRRWSRASIDLS